METAILWGYCKYPDIGGEMFMAVHYVCKHCGMSLGEINNQEVSEFQLGFHFLTPEERRDIITYNSDGDVTVKLICDYCAEALQSHPELSLAPSPLQ